MPGMIKKEDIEKVRATADLYDIVSATVTLKPSGTGTYVGLCPFHDEKTPSFSVRPALGVWHCFGCGLGGDVFGYVEHQENIDFRDAVELLADKYHIELHYDKADNVPPHTVSPRTLPLATTLALQPGIAQGLVESKDIVADLVVGYSGAGKNLKRTNLLAAEAFGSALPYSVGGTHRHIPEKIGRAHV